MSDVTHTYAERHKQWKWQEVNVFDRSGVEKHWNRHTIWKEKKCSTLLTSVEETTEGEVVQ